MNSEEQLKKELEELEEFNELVGTNVSEPIKQSLTEIARDFEKMHALKFDDEVKLMIEYHKRNQLHKWKK